MRRHNLNISMASCLHVFCGLFLSTLFKLCSSMAGVDLELEWRLFASVCKCCHCCQYWRLYCLRSGVPRAACAQHLWLCSACALFAFTTASTETLMLNDCHEKQVRLSLYLGFDWFPNLISLLYQVLYWNLFSRKRSQRSECDKLDESIANIKCNQSVQKYHESWVSLIWALVSLRIVSPTYSVGI